MTSDEPTPHPPAPTVPRYEIRIDGRLGPGWAASFDGLSVTTEARGITLISGPVADQAALHGLLAKLRDLGIPLVSLVRTPGATARSTIHQQPGASS